MEPQKNSNTTQPQDPNTSSPTDIPKPGDPSVPPVSSPTPPDTTPSPTPEFPPQTEETSTTAPEIDVSLASEEVPNNSKDASPASNDTSFGAGAPDTSQDVAVSDSPAVSEANDTPVLPVEAAAADTPNSVTGTGADSGAGFVAPGSAGATPVPDVSDLPAGAPDASSVPPAVAPAVPTHKDTKSLLLLAGLVVVLVVAAVVLYVM